MKKAAILYFSETGNTKEMARLIKAGMESENVEVKAFPLDEVDDEWVKASDCIIMGTPVYYTGTVAKIDRFIETMGKYNLAGKLGGAFATAAYTWGGGEIAMQTILTRMLFYGMMVYSSGSSAKPPIHMGPLYINGNEATKEIFPEYGKRMAQQLNKLG